MSRYESSNAPSDASTSTARYGGGPPRRQHSDASTRSAQGSSKSATRPATPASTNHIETTTTKLLVATKKLLEELTNWSNGGASDQAISDCFNQACAAFAKEGISMKDLAHVPDALRVTLEEALAEEASPDTLKVHLPGVRNIVIELLGGLRAKQNQLRDLQARKQAERQLEGTSRSVSPSAGSDASGRRVVTPGPSRPPGSSLDAVISSANGVPRPTRTPSPDQARRGPAAPSASRPPRRQMSGEEGWSSDTSASRPGSLASSAPGSPPPQSRPRQESAGMLKSKSGSSLATVREGNAPVPPARAGSKPSEQRAESPALQPSALPQLPALGPLPNFGIEPPTPTVGTPPASSEDPATQQSLESLRQSDALQRRASKRFSQYTYHKMTATPSPSIPNIGASASTALATTALPSVPSNPLLHSPSGEDATAARELAAKTSSRVPSSSPRAKNRLSTAMEEDEEEPAVTHSAPMATPGTLAPSAQITSNTSSATVTPDRGSIVIHSDERTVYLQLGREVKKAKIEGEPTTASLRLLFIDRFAYNPGSLDFPAIYVRDGNVQYELEDMSEVTEGTVLTLNIEPLDEVKQLFEAGFGKFETGLGSLAKELKELRTLVSARQSMPPSAVSASDAPSTPPQARPSDRQFAAAAQRVAKISSEAPPRPPSRSRTSDIIAAAAAPMSPSASVTSINAIADAHTQRIMSDLKAHFDEVQNVRRDVGILRQIQSDFGTETKAMISKLREQAVRVKTVANEKINVERESINAGKAKLDTRSQDLLTRIEELQDTTEDMRRDLIEKRSRPRPAILNQLKANVAATKKELDELAEFVQMVEPQWRKTWTAELQAVIDEQDFLRHHRDQLSDLQADHEAMSKMLANIDQFATLNSSASASTSRAPPMLNINGTGDSSNPVDALGPGRLRPFVPRIPSPSTVAEGDKPFLAQVQGIEPDPERRLRAIEQAEKLRQKEKASGAITSAATTSEGGAGDLLSEVKEGKKLKRTGGVEEVERMVEVNRLRSQKSSAALRAQIENGSPAVPPAPAPAAPAQPSDPAASTTTAESTPTTTATT